MFSVRKRNKETEKKHNSSAENTVSAENTENLNNIDDLTVEASLETENALHPFEAGEFVDALLSREKA